jgi:hypothetical protein
MISMVPYPEKLRPGWNLAKNHAIILVRGEIESGRLDS